MTDLPSAKHAAEAILIGETQVKYFGCRGPDILPSLVDLEHKIDEVAGTEKWIK